MAPKSANAAELLINVGLKDEELKKFNKSLKSMGVEAKYSAETGKLALQQVESQTKKSAESMAKTYATVIGAAMAMRKMFDETKALTQAQAKQEQVLRSTAQAAGLTAKDLQRMAAAMGEATGAKQADIMEAQNLLLTFTSISKDVFEDVAMAAADMSATFKQDLKQSCVQLGKALQDPVAGAAALKEVGVALNEQQIAQIKTYMAQNKLMEAQKVILKELQVETGGQAKALRNTDVGTLEAMWNKFNDTIANVGQIVFPIFADLADALAGVFGWFQKLPDGIQRVLIVVGGLAAAFISPIAAIVGVGLAIGAMFKSTASQIRDLTKVNEEAAAAIDSVQESMKRVGKSDALLEQLKSAKTGTEEYKRIVQELISLNPELKQKNLDLASSYDTVAQAVNQISGQISDQGKLEAFNRMKQMESNLSSGLRVLMKKSTDDSADGVREYNAAKQQYDEGLKLYFRSAKLAGGIDYDAALKRYQDRIRDEFQFARMFSSYDRGKMRALLAGGGNFRDYYNGSENMRLPLAVNRTTATTGAGDAQKLETIDGKRALYEQEIRFLDELTRKRMMAEWDFLAEYQKVQDTKYTSEEEKQAYLKAIQLKYASDVQDIELERIKANEEAEKEAIEKKYQSEMDVINAVQDGYNTVKDTFKKAAEGDVAGATSGALSKIGQATKTTWLSWAGMGISIIGDIFSLFSSKSETAAERLKKKLEELKAIADFRGSTADTMKAFLGGDTKESIGIRRKGLTEQRDQLFALLGIDPATASPEALAAMAANLGDEFQRKLAEFQAFAPTVDAWDVKGQKRLKAMAENLTAMSRQVNLLKELGPVMEALRDSSGKDLVVDAEKELERIRHEEATGEMTHAEALTAQLSQYDSMIAALQGVSGAEELIKKLEEDRFKVKQDMLNIDKESAELAGKYYEGAKGARLTELRKAQEQLERDITTGKLRAGAASTVSMQVGLMDAIISNLKSQGATEDELYKFRKQKADLLKETYGNDRWAKKSGSGSDVGWDQTMYNPDMAWITPAVTESIAQSVVVDNLRAAAAAKAQYMQSIYNGGNTTNDNSVRSLQVAINANPGPASEELAAAIRKYLRETGIDLRGGN